MATRIWLHAAGSVVSPGLLTPSKQPPIIRALAVLGPGALVRVYAPVKIHAVGRAPRSPPVRLREWLLRNILLGTVCVHTGEVVADVPGEQVGEGVGEFGPVSGWWCGRRL